jgi:pyrimidine oxygenase
MEDCRLSPRPQVDMKIICAGQSDAGMAFSAQYADYNFCFGKGVNTPTAFAPTVAKLNAATAKTGRDVRAYALFMIIADETDEAARAKWESYKDGTDQEAVAWLMQQSDADKSSGKDTNVRQMVDPVSVVNINMGTLVGSFETVAKLLDEVATVPGCEGVLLTFDDFIKGTEDFGARIQPLMKSRQTMETV